MNEDNVLVQIEARKSWNRARQAAGMEELLSLLPIQSTELLPFEEVKNQLRLRQRTYRGVREVPLEQIVGSVGRYRDFTRTFLPRSPELRQRWVRVSAAAATVGVPPIEVYQVGEAYFVLDGNHRVSVAHQNGAKAIEAHVWEFDTPVGLSAGADLNEVLIKAEYAQFLEQTHLDQLRPEAGIVFTTPGRYYELEWQIELYRQALEKIDEQPVSYEDAVMAWYDMIYTPAIQIIQGQGVMGHFPDRTEADLFIWVWRHCQELRERQGSALLADVAGAMANAKRRGILAYIWQLVEGLFHRQH